MSTFCRQNSQTPLVLSHGSEEWCVLKISFTREEDGWWRAEIKDTKLTLPAAAVVVRGQSIQHARNKAKAKLRNVVRTQRLDIDTSLTEHIALPRILSTAVRAYKSSRKRVEEARSDVKTHQREVANTLLSHKMSTRDCAEILGVSRQRAQQLLDAQRKLREDNSPSMG